MPYGRRRYPLYSIWNAPSDIDYYLGVGRYDEAEDEEQARQESLDEDRQTDTRDDPRQDYDTRREEQMDTERDEEPPF